MRVLLIESIPLLREALIRQIESQPQWLLEGVFDTVERMEYLNMPDPPDILWLDGNQLNLQESDFIKRIRRQWPQTRVLIFGSSDSIPEIKNYFKQGVRGYLPKTSAAPDIQSALCMVASDELYVPASLNRAFTAWLTDQPRKKKPGNELTQREKEILFLIVEEHTTNEIARKLFISQCTVETHRINLIQKLGVKNTAGLVRVAFEAGLYNRSFV